MSLRPVAPLLTLTALTLFANGLPSEARAPSQGQDRSIRKLKLPKEPVEISSVKNKTRKLKLDEKFLADDDWLRGFTVTLVNTSGKNITSLSVELTFLRPAGHETSGEPPLGYPMRFNPSPFQPEYALRDKSRVVKPGETIDLVLRDDEYEGIKRFLEQLNYPGGARRVEIMIHTVGFDDGTAWAAGTRFHPDADKPDKLVPEPEPLGRVPKGPADFFAFNHVRRGRGVQIRCERNCRLGAR